MLIFCALIFPCFCFFVSPGAEAAECSAHGSQAAAARRRVRAAHQGGEVRTVAGGPDGPAGEGGGHGGGASGGEPAHAGAAAAECAAGAGQRYEVSAWPLGAMGLRKQTVDDPLPLVVEFLWGSTGDTLPCRYTIVV